MGGEPLEPMESFEAWLLRRVAQAVEAGDVPAQLPEDLRAEFEAARSVSQEEGHIAALRRIADIAGVSLERAAEVLATIESQSSVARELFMRGIAEVWLEGHRKAYRRDGSEGRYRG